MLKFSIKMMLVAILSLMFVLTGCSSSKKGERSTSDLSSTSVSKSDTGKVSSDTKSVLPVKIKCTYGLSELGGTNVIQDFEKENPDIKVELIPLYGQDPKLSAMIAAGNAPDVIRIDALSEFTTFAVNGDAMELDSYIQKSGKIKLDDLFDINDIFRFDGKVIGKGRIYGIVKDWSLDGELWINKKLFTEAKIPIPEEDEPMTYSQLAEIAKKLTKWENGKVVQTGLGTYLSDYQITEIMLAQKGKSIWTSDFLGTTLNSVDTQKALKYWADLMQAGAMNSALNLLPDTWGINLFQQDKVGMLMAGYWVSGNLRSNIKLKDRMDDFKLLPQPVIEGGKRMAMCSSGTGAIIYKGTKHPDEAYKLWEYIQAGPPSDLRAVSGWGLPAFKSKLNKLPNTTVFDKQAFGVVSMDIRNFSTAPRINPYISYEDIGNAFDKYFVPALFNKVTLGDACLKLDEELSRLSREGEAAAGVK